MLQQVLTLQHPQQQVMPLGLQLHLAVACASSNSSAAAQPAVKCGWKECGKLSLQLRMLSG
jgi:hypothetical protein